VASVISLMSPDLYWMSLLFSIAGLVYMFTVQKKNPKAAKSMKLLVFSSLLVALLVSSLLYLYADADADGVYDRNDDCPQVYGLNDKGCPKQ
jgi:FtsH-binding integral membrane protein